MRKPRDFDSELKALNERATQLRTRKLQQLGELVIATGADALQIEELAGALLVAVGPADKEMREGWHKRGAAFFQGSRKSAAARKRRQPCSTGADRGSAPSAPSADRA
jgi:hypothetical protein